jgi:hypothetical protein
MTRYALLGMIAGLSAATGAVQAADLPVAPEPVDYVRVCDAYGSRFYYIPGTETCLRVGGRVRVDTRFRNFGEKENAWSTRSADGLQLRTRGYLYLDARTATEFGTLRAYVNYYGQVQNGAESFSVDNIYIQWGGLTAGFTSSYFDFYTGYAFGAQTESYSDQDTNLIGYTFAFGNGFNASVAIEDNASRQAGVGFNNAVQGYGGTRMPDIVGALGISQGWGEAQVMGALHQIYSNTLVNSTGGGSEDELGWALGAGAEVKFGGIANGGTVALQVVYTDGASTYGSTGWNGRITDAVVVGSGIDTTKTINVFGGVSLGLTNTLEVNLQGGYHNVDGGTAAYDFTQWDATANAVWEPVSGFEIGPELQYRNLDFNRASGLDDTYELYGTFRVQRTF